MVVVVGYRKLYRAPDTAQGCGVASLVLSIVGIVVGVINFVVYYVVCHSGSDNSLCSIYRYASGCYWLSVSKVVDHKYSCCCYSPLTFAIFLLDLVLIAGSVAPLSHKSLRRPEHR